jgi:hypothetical protein
MWGASLEAIEMQVLTLHEVRALAADVAREGANPRRVLDEYVRLLADRFKGQPPLPLYQAVGGEDEQRFVTILREVSARLREPASIVSDDELFSRSYLAIDLRFAPGQFLSTQAVTSYYEDFRRAMRSLARYGTGRTGRVEKPIEIATDFALESMQITPLNGVPARARLELGAPYAQLDFRGGKVHEAIDQIMDLASRADAQGFDAVLDFGGDLDAETRTRALVQTMRVLPRGGIEEVTLGGTYTARAPVRLRKLHAPKLMAAVAKDMEPSNYDQITLIRAIDLDRGSLIHGRTPRDRIACHASSDLLEGVTTVGVLARIVGKRYEPPSGSPFVIVEQIELVSERADVIDYESRQIGGATRRNGKAR